MLNRGLFDVKNDDGIKTCALSQVEYRSQLRVGDKTVRRATNQHHQRGRFRLVQNHPNQGPSKRGKRRFIFSTEVAIRADRFKVFASAYFGAAPPFFRVRMDIYRLSPLARTCSDSGRIRKIINADSMIQSVKLVYRRGRHPRLNTACFVTAARPCGMNGVCALRDNLRGTTSCKLFND